MTAGIVCEYNPLHNGHLYHIEKTKAAGADTVVCVMSGNFVQRGECALIDKWQRAVCAIRGGADIVLDLPTPWAVSSAENFARGSVYILSGFGVDMLSFGSETDDKELLKKCASATENEAVAQLIRKYTAEGMSYPWALSQGVGQLYGEKAKRVISTPNSTLGVEYIRQLSFYAPKADFISVKRIGTDHDSEAVSEGFASASKIRSMLYDDVSAFVPGFMNETIKNNMNNGTVHTLSKAERAILSSLREIPKEDYADFVTDGNGLSSRIYEGVKTAKSLAELYENAKSKNFTHARVRREVLNLYLRIPRDMCCEVPPYIKILAANERGLSLLSSAKENSSLPIVTKHADRERLSVFGKAVYDLQCTCTDKFSLMCDSIRPCGEEQRNSMIIIK